MQPTSIATHVQNKADGLYKKHHELIMLVFDAIVEATASQVAINTKLDYQQVLKRLSELERDNLIYDTGRKGISPSGKRCIIWRKVSTGVVEQQMSMF